jgi:hypothetical protein
MSGEIACFANMQVMQFLPGWVRQIFFFRLTRRLGDGC